MTDLVAVDDLEAALERIQAERDALWASGAPVESFELLNAERDALAEQLMRADGPIARHYRLLAASQN